MGGRAGGWVGWLVALLENRLIAYGEGWNQEVTFQAQPSKMQTCPGKIKSRAPAEQVTLAVQAKGALGECWGGRQSDWALCFTDPLRSTQITQIDVEPRFRCPFLLGATSMGLWVPCWQRIPFVGGVLLAHTVPQTYTLQVWLRRWNQRRLVGCFVGVLFCLLPLCVLRHSMSPHWFATCIAKRRQGARLLAGTGACN